jgi:Flp pilus assembly CpaF family ATPase
MMAGIELPHRTVRRNIADALDLAVHVERRRGKRFVKEVIRVNGYDSAGDQYDLETIYTLS